MLAAEEELTIEIAHVNGIEINLKRMINMILEGNSC